MTNDERMSKPDCHISELRGLDGNAAMAGLGAATLLALAIFMGSHGLRHFDPAVSLYPVGSVLAAFAVAYRFTVWYQRPPSKIIFQRSVQIALGRLPKHYRPQADPAEDARTRRHLSKPPMSVPALRKRTVFNRFMKLRHSLAHELPLRCLHPNPPSRKDREPTAVTLTKAAGDKILAQSFIRRRSWYRWIMHLCLSGGCTLAFALTFPLVFGWIHFSTLPDNAEIYRAHVFGFAVDEFNIHSVKAFFAFNLLNLAGILVMVGLVLAALRRLTNSGVRATQTFAEDILPLILIFAVTATGLMLTVSYKFLDGRGHGGMAIVHMFSVIALLFYIPYGKLFHMFQRSASLCVSLYQKAGRIGPRARCRVCRDVYTSQMHVDDLVSVLDQLGFNYRYATDRGEVHYQEICPRCRRRLFALNQGKVLGR